MTTTYTVKDLKNKLEIEPNSKMTFKSPESPEGRASWFTASDNHKVLFVETRKVIKSENK